MGILTFAFSQDRLISSCARRIATIVLQPMQSGLLRRSTVRCRVTDTRAADDEQRDFSSFGAPGPCGSVLNSPAIPAATGLCPTGKGG